MSIAWWLAAPLVLIRAYFRGRRNSSAIYGADYDKRAQTYDHAKGRSEMGGVSARLVEKIGCEGARRILDLGCGTGQVTQLLAEKYPGAHVDGVDISEGMLAQASEKAEQLANATFHRADMEAWCEGAPEGDYDIVTCMWAIGYARPARVMKSIARVLAPGGRVAIVVNMRHSLIEIQRLYAAELLRRPWCLERVPHVGFPPSVAKFERWARKAGFETEYLAESGLVFEFADGREFGSWLRTAGQSAGLEASMKAGSAEEIFEAIERRIGGSPFKITHRFVEYVGSRRG